MEMWEQLQLRVEQLVRARGVAGLDAADELLNGVSELTDEQRSALWLYGWSLLPDGAGEARRYLRELARRARPELN